MAKDIKVTTTTTVVENNSSLFGRENYYWMIAGFVVIVLGFILMSGGRSSDPKVFDPKVVYSSTRITIAPILIIAGFILEIIGIMKKTKVVAG